MPWLSPARPWLWPREASSSLLWPHCSQVALKGTVLPGAGGQGGPGWGQAASAGWWREDVCGGSTMGGGEGEQRLCWLFLAGVCCAVVTSELVHR